MNPFNLPRIACGGLVPVAAYVLAATFFARPVFADEWDTVNFVLSDTFSYNTNLFRTPDSSAPPVGFSTKSDRVHVFSAGLRIDKPYAQQRFQFDVTASARRYDTFSYLNADTVDYRGAWLWALTPRITGTLSADRTQAPLAFDTIGGTQLILRTTENRIFTIDGWVSGGWHVLAGLAETESTTPQVLLGAPSFKSHGVGAGLRYVAASGNSITFMQRSMPTELVNQPLDPVNLIDTNYRDTESELKVIWNPSGHSRLDGTLTRKERRNDHFTQRDFSGTAGELRYVWAPIGKLTFNFAAIRSILPYAAFGNSIENSSYKVDQTLSLESVWQATARTKLRLGFLRTHSDFRGPVFAITGPARSDQIYREQVGVEWTPARYWTLSAALERERRSSNIAGFDFSNTMATVRALLTF